jgi:hypothetical protein
MHNVEWNIADEKLVITIDLSETAIANAPESASGKTNLISSTGSGFYVNGPGLPNMTLAMNLFFKPSKR